MILRFCYPRKFCYLTTNIDKNTSCGNITIKKYSKDALLEIIEIGNKNNVQWVCTGTRKDGIPRHPSRGKYRDIIDFDPRKLLFNK